MKHFVDIGFHLNKFQLMNWCRGGRGTGRAKSMHQTSPPSGDEFISMLPQDMGSYQIYTDNYYGSLDLARFIKQCGFQSTLACRKNRLPILSLFTPKTTPAGPFCSLYSTSDDQSISRYMWQRTCSCLSTPKSQCTANGDDNTNCHSRLHREGHGICGYIQLSCCTCHSKAKTHKLATQGISLYATPSRNSFFACFEML